MRLALLPAITFALLSITSPAQRAAALPFVIGTADSDAGNIVANLVANAQSVLVDVSVVTSSTFDTAFFNGIDVFVFANGAGNLSVTLGSTARTNLLNFVTGGGHAYLGLDDISIGSPTFDNDGTEVAALFGFNLTDRQSISENGTVTDPTHPITTGPFQPASTFQLSFTNRFDHDDMMADPLPSGGSLIGQGASGRDALAFLAGDALGGGSGKVYIYSDEVPLFGSSGGANEHDRLFQNALVDMGAMVVPEPGSGLLLGLGLLVLGCRPKR